MTGNVFSRISGRAGNVIELNASFYQSGQLAAPFAIRYIEIYKSQVIPHNLVATIPIVDPTDPEYPSPLVQQTDSIGSYVLPFLVPRDFAVPDIYYDVWYYYPTDPCSETELTEPTDPTEPTEPVCDLDNLEVTSQLLKCCHRFWLYPDEWLCEDGLSTVRFGFEPLDQQFHQPEVRTIEIGLMPLPLYDYDYNLVNPMIPYLKASITIETQHCEILVDDEPCRIGIRQGSFRSNPWVIQYQLDTSRFLKGTYRYFIKVLLPNGESRVSKKYILTIS